MKNTILIPFENSVWAFPDKVVQDIFDGKISGDLFKDLYFVKLILIMESGGTQHFWSYLLSKEECVEISKRWLNRIPLIEEVSDPLHINSKKKIELKYKPERMLLSIENFIESSISEIKGLKNLNAEILMSTLDEKDFINYQKNKLKNKVSNLN